MADAQRLLQLDALHEPTHRQLMRLLAQTGQRSAALTQYETCRHLLATELNVPPDEMTVALYEQIRTGDLHENPLRAIYDVRDHGADELAFVNRKSEFVNRHNLPPQSTPFIGREAELAQIETLLANLDCRSLTLLGVGGIGKTRLAIEAATRQLGNFADGVYFVPLVAITDGKFLATALAQSLNLTLRGEGVFAQLIHYVRPRHLLLVLDNFEHLLHPLSPSSGKDGADAAEMVATLVRQAPRLKVLVTTRTRLQLLEEWLLPVDGFCVGDNLLGPATQLFLRSAQRVQPTFSAAGQSEAITTICRQVGGMPLAIELAASWVRLMSCAEIARQLAHNFDLLNTALRNIPARHRSIRTLFEQSWRLLMPEEQVALRRLSVFQGDWTIDEATQVLDVREPQSNDFRLTLSDSAEPITPDAIQNPKSKIQNLLLALEDKSLVRSNGQNRYDLHELVRQYAAEQLMASGELETIRQRHFATYLALVRTADAKLRGPEAVAWFNRLETEQGNLRAALQWALDQGHYADVAWMGIGLCYFWRRKVRWRETYLWLAPTLAHDQAWSVELRLANLINLYAYRLAESDQELKYYVNELAQLAQCCNAKVLRAFALYMIGRSVTDATQSTNAYAEALLLLRQCAGSNELPAEFCAFGDATSLLALLTAQHGQMLRGRGDYAQAATFFQESISIAHARGDRNHIFHPIGNLGCLALTQGDLAQAEQLIGEAAQIAQAVGDVMGIADWQPYLALVKFYQGKVEEAWGLLQVCLAHADLQHMYLLRKAQAVAALVALAQGELDQAEVFLHASLVNFYRHHPIRPELVDCLFTAARLATARQQFARAVTLFGLTERVRVEIHHTLDAPMRPLVEAALATVHAALEPAVFAEAFSTGQQLSLTQAFASVI